MALVGNLLLTYLDSRERTIEEIVVLEKDCQRIEPLGLTLPEAKRLLQTLHQQLA